ncbi:MAG: hypothetical protein KGZ83_07020 [Sulfuricella sp.]|nr:hypothetical protein [Sulfuricella sp.]
MSELHISLAIAGVLIVVGVYFYNLYQENRLRSKAQQAFTGGEEDVLLKQEGEGLPDDGERREPSMDFSLDGPEAAELTDDILDVPAEIVSPASTPEPVTAAAVAPSHVAEKPASAASAFDEVVDFVATLTPVESFQPGDAARFAAALEGFAGAVRLLGLNRLTGQTETLEEARQGYAKFFAVLQLVNRSGAVNPADLADFCRRVEGAAAALGASASFPEQAEAATRAAMLDEFCVSVDILIGVNVVSSNGDLMPATKIRALAESNGMKLNADGTFHSLNEDGVTLFTLANFDQTPFSAENIRHLSIHGVTLLLDVPKVAPGLRIFDQMLLQARQIGNTLNAVLVDDNRRPLTDNGIAKIKSQLATIYTKMDAAGIPPGSERATRLFS